MILIIPLNAILVKKMIRYQDEIMENKGIMFIFKIEPQIFKRFFLNWKKTKELKFWAKSFKESESSNFLLGKTNTLTK